MFKEQKDKNKHIIFTCIIYINLIIQFCDPISVFNCLRLNTTFLKYFINSNYDNISLNRVIEMLDCHLYQKNDYFNNEKESIHFLKYLLYKRFKHRPSKYHARDNLPKYFISDKEYMTLIFEAHFKIKYEDCYFLEFYNLNRIASYLNLIKTHGDIVFPWRKFLLRRWINLFRSMTIWNGFYFHYDSINIDFFNLETVLELISLWEDFWICNSLADAIRSIQKKQNFDNDVLIKWNKSYIKKFKEPLFCYINFESCYLERKLFCDGRPTYGNYCRYHKNK